MCCSLALNNLPTNDLMPSSPSETTRSLVSRHRPLCLPERAVWHGRPGPGLPRTLLGSACQIARQLGQCRRRIQMDLARRAAGKKPDAVAPRDGGIVPRLLTSTLGGGLSAGRTLFTEIRKLGYVGCYSGLAKLLSPWRQPKAEARKAISALSDATQLEVTTPTGSRQLSPQVAAALLSKVRTELTSRQAQIVDPLKRQRPGLAEMRKLVLGFRTILRRASRPPCIAGWSRHERRVSIRWFVLCEL
jgi:hypothetical protein